MVLGKKLLFEYTSHQQSYTLPSLPLCHPLRLPLVTGEPLRVFFDFSPTCVRLGDEIQILPESGFLTDG